MVPVCPQLYVTVYFILHTSLSCIRIIKKAPVKLDRCHWLSQSGMASPYRGATHATAISITYNNLYVKWKFTSHCTTCTTTFGANAKTAPHPLIYIPASKVFVRVLKLYFMLFTAKIRLFHLYYIKNCELRLFRQKRWKKLFNWCNRCKTHR